MRIPISALPKADPRITTNSDMADNADIREAIFNAVPDAIGQTQDLAKYFARTSARETCKAVFDFLKNDIRYEADGHYQIIRLPSALMRTKVGDCKSYSVFTSGILSNLGIPHFFRMVSYSANPTPSHIYVVTDDGCIIDAVWGTFDSEKTPTFKYDVKPNGNEMKVQTMTGIPTAMGACGCASCSMTGLFKRSPEKKAAAQRKKDERKDAREAKRDARDSCGKQGAKPVTLAAGRWIFLLMVQANLDGFATKLSGMDKTKIANTWCKTGGNPESILKAIQSGSSRKARRIGFLDSLAKAAGIKINGIGMTSQGIKPITEAQSKAMLAKAAPISLATSTAVGAAVGQPTKGAAASGPFLAVVREVWPMIMDLVNALKPQDLGAPEGGPISPLDNYNNEFPPSNGGDDKKSSTMTYLLIGAAAVGAFFILKK